MAEYLPEEPLFEDTLCRPYQVMSGGIKLPQIMYEIVTLLNLKSYHLVIYLRTMVKIMKQAKNITLRSFYYRLRSWVIM